MKGSQKDKYAQHVTLDSPKANFISLPPVSDVRSMEGLHEGSRSTVQPGFTERTSSPAAIRTEAQANLSTLLSAQEGTQSLSNDGGTLEAASLHPQDIQHSGSGRHPTGTPQLAGASQQGRLQQGIQVTASLTAQQNAFNLEVASSDEGPLHAGVALPLCQLGEEPAINQQQPIQVVEVLKSSQTLASKYLASTLHLDGKHKLEAGRGLPEEQPAPLTPLGAADSVKAFDGVSKPAAPQFCTRSDEPEGVMAPLGKGPAKTLEKTSVDCSTYDLRSLQGGQTTDSHVSRAPFTQPEIDSKAAEAQRKQPRQGGTHVETDSDSATLKRTHPPQHTGDTGTALQQSSFSDGGLLGTSAIESGGLHNDAAEGPEFGLSDGLPRSLSEADSQGVQTGLPLSSTLGTDLQAGSQRFETMGRTLRAGEGDSLSETARRRARSRKPRFAFPRKDGNEEGHQEAVSFRGTDTLKDQSQVCSCSVVAVLADASSKAKGKDAN